MRKIQNELQSQKRNASRSLPVIYNIVILALKFRGIQDFEKLTLDAQ
jgi:hypothetical protein